MPLYAVWRSSAQNGRLPALQEWMERHVAFASMVSTKCMKPPYALNGMGGGVRGGAMPPTRFIGDEGYEGYDARFYHHAYHRAYHRACYHAYHRECLRVFHGQ